MALRFDAESRMFPTHAFLNAYNGLQSRIKKIIEKVIKHFNEKNSIKIIYKSDVKEVYNRNEYIRSSNQLCTHYEKNMLEWVIFSILLTYRG